MDHVDNRRVNQGRYKSYEVMSARPSLTRHDRSHSPGPEVAEREEQELEGWREEDEEEEEDDEDDEEQKPFPIDDVEQSSLRQTQGYRHTTLAYRAKQSKNLSPKNRPASQPAPQPGAQARYLFTVLTRPEYQDFVHIPVHDLSRRISFLRSHPEILSEDNVAKVQTDFMRQAVEFWRSEEHMASICCSYCLALIQVSKNQKASVLDEYFRSLQRSGSSDQRNLSTTIYKIQDLVKQKVAEEQPSDSIAVEGLIARLGTEANNANKLGATNARAIDPATSDNPAAQMLNPAYKQRGGTWFKPGKVFAILWHEGAGEPRKKTTDALMDPGQQELRDLNPALSQARFGSTVFTHIRRMVVIRNRHGSCWCVSIGTYGGRGLLKSGLSEDDINAHAVIYDTDKGPKYFKNEPRSNKREIAVVTVKNASLDPASRVHLGNPYDVEWNLKVMDIGQVVPEDLEALIGFVKDELFG
ncbi:hypothetical protein LTR05_001873 [Lithohypha guttulata]|uniref:DUF6590 domain-containing protein n=1 Tax=Lithohypha guttulata TaxID=1690604 RepID=A0AAN7T785_9EURO|nr:hypothetical protein LTR05_001873 [Lithohypha guttulata]